MSQARNTVPDPVNWDSFFEGGSVLDQIRMWDFFGGRPYILRHVGRQGKAVEAGCGLGRYVFYLERLGIDIEGVDFSRSNIDLCNVFAKEHGFRSEFRVADVCSLPYEDNSIATCISLGVMEHFVEGPHRALREAWRVLRPGGVAIITTPAPSWTQKYYSNRLRLTNAVKRRLGMEPVIPEFFQYWYSLDRMKKFVREAGFTVVYALNTDYIYPLWEIGRMKRGVPPVARLSAKFEHRNIPFLAAQNIIIALKRAPEMHCFLSGEYGVSEKSLRDFYLPVSDEMTEKPYSNYYRHPRRRNFPSAPYQWNPPVTEPFPQRCHFSGETYTTDPIFEDYGFTIPCSPSSLRKPECNIPLSFKYVQMRWRNISE